MKKALLLIGKIFSWIFTVTLALVLVLVLYQKFTGNVPGFFGYHIMYVLTGSMSPELDAGDAIVVKSTDAESLKVGDVICYHCTTGEMKGQLITHKVIKAPYDKDGERFLLTKGVANPEPDDPIRTEQVFGIVILRMKILGRLYKFFCTVPGLITILAPILIMMVFEIRHINTCVKEEMQESVEQATEEAKREAEEKNAEENKETTEITEEDNENK